MCRPLLSIAIALLLLGVFSAPLTGQERLCDTQYEDCRAPLIQLIRQERQAIDVAFWFMEDMRYVTELINRHNAGVPVRILVDQRANASKRLNEDMLRALRDAGIPMRDKFVGDILHFKMMLFNGQNMLEFSKANYTPASFVPIQPNVNFDDETIYFTNDSNLTNSFRRRFDDLWINTTQYRDFANIRNPPVRSYPLFNIHPSMNFVPLQDFADRAVSRYNAESQGIDAIAFRITDHRQADALINAVARGVPVRIITEPSEYRNPERIWHSKHVDRMWMAGVQIKHRQHQGLAHSASVLLHGLGEVIFGSSNWTSASAGYQDEHNYFYSPGLNKPWFFQWFANQFWNKWTNTTNYVPFQPLPPGTPTNFGPVNGSSGHPSSITLAWDGGPWAHLYDIYLGTNPNPPLLASNVELGGPVEGQNEFYTVNNLLQGTTYYWRVVGKTWAQLQQGGPIWSFTTAGGSPPPPPPTITLSRLIGGDSDANAWGDLLAQDISGAVTLGLNSGARFQTVKVFDSATPWALVGVGNFDNVGNLDVVWQHPDGPVVLWTLNNSTVPQASLPLFSGASTWRIVAVADVDLDRNADLIWQSPTGQVVVWFMQGQNLRSTQELFTGTTEWRVVTAADFNGDRSPDVVWQNPAGQVVIWLMQGVSHRSSSVLFGGSTAWRIMAVADLDGNGHSDLIWRGPAGYLVVWSMNGASQAGTLYLTLGPQWLLSSSPPP
jgi:hypothetical protein